MSNSGANLASLYTPVKSASSPYPFNRAARTLTGALHAVCGIDTLQGQLIAWDGNNANFSQSDDWAATWKNLSGVPANIVNNQPYHKVVRFGNYLYSMHIDATDGLLGVYRAPAGPAGTGSLVWSDRLTTMTANEGPAVTGISTALNAGHAAIMLGDYGDFETAGGPKIQRSTDGVTWTVVYGPDPTSRHVHSVVEDPYNPGVWYALLGDTGNTKTMIRSTDDGLTWATIIPATNANQWSGVQISFTAAHIYVASDRPGITAWFIDRDELVPRSVATNWHYNIGLPGAMSGRVVTDLAVTAGSSVVTSVTANFTALDVGRELTEVTRFIPGMFIASVQSASQVTLTNDTQPATASSTASGLSAFIGGDRLLGNAFMGAVDPATGVYYASAVDTSYRGNAPGIVYCPSIGGRFEVLDWRPTGYGIDAGEVFIGGGKVWIQRDSFPLIEFT